MKNIIALIFICITVQAFSAQKMSYHENDPFSTRMLFLFFDNSETLNVTQNERVPVIIYNVITALSEKLPFIATSKLMHNAFTYLSLFHDAQTLSYQAFTQKHQQAPSTLYSELKKVKLVIDKVQQHLATISINNRDINNAIYLSELWDNTDFKTFLQNNTINIDALKNYWHLYLYSTIHYNPEEWVTKKLNDSLYLCIPKSRYPQLLNTYSPLQKQPHTYTNLELQIGLALDHLPDVTADTLRNISFTQQTNKFEFVPEQLFVPLSAYKNTDLTPQSWSFYLSAHGSPPQLIAPYLKGYETEIRDSWKYIKTFDDPFHAFAFPQAETKQIIKDAIENIEHNNYTILAQNISKIRAELPKLTLKKTFKEQLILNCDQYLQNQASTTINNVKLRKLISSLYQKLHLLNNDIATIIGNSTYFTYYLTNAQKYKKLQQQGISTFNHIGELDTFALHALFTFFNNEIDTRCVIINACYSGSETFITLQKNLETLSNYNFTLMVQGITDTVTFSAHLPFILPYIPFFYLDKSAKNIVFASERPYGHIFTLLTRTVPWPSVPEIAQRLSGNLPSYDAQNIVQYKQPHLAWSTVALEPHTTVTLQKTLIDNHSGPLSISTFFGKQTYDRSTKTIKKQNAYPKNIIISAPEIPFPLVFERTNNQEFPTIIAAEPTNTMHYITEINALQYTLEEILKGFFTLGPTLASEKAWYIDNIKARGKTINNVRMIMHVQLPNVQEPINIILYQDPQSQKFMREFWYAKNPFPQNLTFAVIPKEQFQSLDKQIQDKGYFIPKTHSGDQKKIVENILQKTPPQKVLLSHARKEFYTLPEDLASLALIIESTK